jgi:hypothetical protein
VKTSIKLFWLCVCGLEAAACSTKGAAGSASASPSAAPKPSASASTAVSAALPPPPKGVKISFDGQEIMFDNAWIYEANGPVIRLSNKPYACSGDMDKDAVTLDFSLRPGPGGKHYAGGKPVAVSVSYSAQQTDKKIALESWENGAQATIESMENKQGEIVKGTLKIDYTDDVGGKKVVYKGYGGFEAKRCEAPEDLGRFAAQETAPDAPVSGTIEGKPFKAQTFLASAANMDGYSWIADIYVVDGPATCADLWEIDKGKKAAVILRPLGTNSREKLTGSPQHADVSINKGDGTNMSMAWDAEAWVELDELAFTPDSTLKGKLAVTTKKVAQGGENFVDATVAGTFEAKVCP